MLFSSGGSRWTQEFCDYFLISTNPALKQECCNRLKLLLSTHRKKNPENAKCIIVHAISCKTIFMDARMPFLYVRMAKYFAVQ